MPPHKNRDKVNAQPSRAGVGDRHNNGAAGVGAGMG